MDVIAIVIIVGMLIWMALIGISGWLLVGYICVGLFTLLLLYLDG